MPRALTYATDRIAAQSANVAYHRQPSYGTFGTHMEVSYLITGVPHEVTFTGVVMDIDRLNQNVEEKANCYEGWVAFNRASGMRNSAYEHQIPEQLFSTDTEQAEGVSTAKALAIAMAQGQRIYTLTQSNASQLNHITIDDGSRNEIQNALANGLEVTVHQSPISVNGWTGSGYAILDADYGVGAYKISGGADGSFFLNLLSFLLAAIGGFADSYVSGARENSPIVLDRTKAANARAFATISKFSGALGLIIATGSAIANDDLSLNQKIGQIASSVFGFLISGYIANAIGLAFLGPGALILGMLVAMALHVAITVLIDRYFATVKQRSYENYA